MGLIVVDTRCFVLVVQDGACCASSAARQRLTTELRDGQRRAARTGYRGGFESLGDVRDLGSRPPESPSTRRTRWTLAGGQGLREAGRGGLGASLGYPALVLDVQGSAIDVLVFESDDLPAHWSRLDEFEGSGYERVATTVSTSDGDLETSIYVLRHEEA
jgi:hypothetical protein